MKQGTDAYARHEQLVAEARAYKAQGHSHKEVAEKFGKSCQWSETYCKGIASQSYLRGNQYTNGKFDQVENARQIIAKHYPNFEYVSGFVNVDSPVVIRCKVCGTERTASMISLRRDGCVACKECQRRELEAQKQQQQQKQRADAVRKEMSKAAHAFHNKRQLSMHFCEGCGAPLFSAKRTYCEDCARERARKYSNVKKERRRVSAMTAMSGQITARSLYERDGGVCWLCGGLCDINADPNANEYPSVDHIVPISKGGKDTWDNVRLAHRQCNSMRFNHENVTKIIKR